MTGSITYDLQTGWEVFEGDESVFETEEKVSLKNAIFMSRRKYMKIDIPYISNVTGLNKDIVISSLKGVIYQNPEKWNGQLYEGWELFSEYVSGNLFEKHRAAKEASARYSNRFDENVKVLEKFMNIPIYFDDVSLYPGIPFVPSEVIDRFIEHIFGNYISAPDFRGNKLPYLVKRDAITASWEIPVKGRYRGWVSNNYTYGTKEKNGINILEDILNNRDIAVYNESSVSNSKKTLNKAATANALVKRDLIIKEFDRWIKNTPEVRRIVEGSYIRSYGCIRKRVFNGSFLQKKWNDIELRNYQLNAIARILFTMNCMLALPVGRGKTFIMLVSALEAVRTNLAKKIIITPPNNVFVQFEQAARQLGIYNEFTFIRKNDFSPKKRQIVLESIRSAESGIYVIPQSCFDLITLSHDYRIKEVKEELDRVVDARGKYLNSTPALKRREKDLRKKLRELESKTSDNKRILCFDELGINMLYVDEVQAYKNITIETSSFARGIKRNGAAKANNMFEKIQHIQKSNGGKGIVLATGTPITNSMTDIYVWQKMLQSGELAMNGLNTFDSWAAEFCEKTTEFEIDVDVTSYRLVTRYSKFVNLPELTSMFSSVAEFYTPEETEGLPEFKGYTDVVIPHPALYKTFLEEVSERVENIRNGNVSPTDDNMLKVTHDENLASADIRHVYPDATFTKYSKVVYCSDKVYEMYVKSAANKGTQLVFCDISTPKAGFNLYDELKRLLVMKGIPAEEIAYIHDATDDNKRAELFEKTRRGEIRVLIGSTVKLGTGVNVQDRCIAAHHLSNPWRPSDIQQREGRILRQGNTNKEIYIFRYIMQGSFDAYSYQILENKQKVISQILKGTITTRNVSEIDETVLSYGEVKALAVGNPLIKERVETNNELSRYRALRSKSDENKILLQRELDEIPELIDKNNELILNCAIDLLYLRKNPPSPDADLRKEIRNKVSLAIRNSVSSLEERVIADDYCGFRIICPAYMTADKPYVYIERNGRYTVEMGESDKGIASRIDNVIAKLPEIHNSYVKSRNALEKRREDIKNEIKNINFYNEEIEFYNELLAEIDRKLEVA